MFAAGWFGALLACVGNKIEVVKLKPKQQYDCGLPLIEFSVLLA